MPQRSCEKRKTNPRLERRISQLNKYLKALQALAVGDAMGMPTEFMTRDTVRRFGLVSELLDPVVSPIHPNLRKGSITDDTEQNLYLIDAYCKSGEITVEGTANALICWVRETAADSRGYIGPSSLKALKAIESGEDPRKTGRGGTTCGAAMRAPAAALCSKNDSPEKLARDIYNCSLPTHNTNLAVEAALAMGFAVDAAAGGAGVEEILKASLEGASCTNDLDTPNYVGASSAWKIKFLIELLADKSEIDEILDTIYYLNGTGLPANEVVPAALAVFSVAKGDVWLSIRMGASVGGDTDTIAALAGLLSALHSGDHNIPEEIVEEVLNVNRLDLSEIAEMIEKRRKSV